MMYIGSGNRGLKQSVDWWLVACYLLLVLIGWLNIYAASHGTDTGSILSFATRSGKQFVWILISSGVAALILFVFNPRLWEVLSIPAYGVVLILLVAVIFMSSDIKGSHSWFSLGPVSFQPAEISKITTSLVLATVMSQQNFKMTRIKDFLLMAAVILIPMAVIVAESETGSALVYVGFIFVLYREQLSGWFIMSICGLILTFILTLVASTYVATLTALVAISLCYSLHNRRIRRWLFREVPIFILLGLLPTIWHSIGGESPEGILTVITPGRILLGLTLAAIPVLAIVALQKKKLSTMIAVLAVIVGLATTYSTQFVFDNVLKDHQRNRIEVLLGLKDDPAGAGYNVAQSKIAIGSGGLFGKGYLGGTQTTYGFVPEQSTDFIFCTVGEEWGFVGCLVVIMLYVILIVRIILDAEKCRETFSRIYGYCVASIIFMHMFINIGMTVGLMPVIGIPLPLLSYGGSSLLGFTVLIFIFLALYRQENKYF